MITLTGVSKTFPGAGGAVEALRDVDLTVERGEIFGIIGRSGAGKSTLIRCINLLERPTAGRIAIDGVDLTALRPAELRAQRRRIGMIFQHFNLLSSRTVYANIALPLELEGRNRGEIAAAVEPLLAFTGLGELRDRYPAQISGGQAQRVGIARALASRPAVLLCDEATSALDPQTTQSILALLREVNREFGVTIVLITHEMAVIKAICDKVAFLEDGHIVESGSVRELFLFPKSATTRAFIGGASADDVAVLAGAPLLPAPAPNGGSAVWRLAFTESSAHESVVSALVRRFALDLNILSGTIERVGNEPLGILIVEITAQGATFGDAQRYLEGVGVHVEVLGYVQRSVSTAS